MESMYSSLFARCRQKHQESLNIDDSSRTIVVLAGPPGSGKSTIAAEVVRRLNTAVPPFNSIVVPMDGFHLSRKTLDQMPNSAEAHERRGAAWTFDVQGVLSLVRTLHLSKNNKSKTILVPGFDHALKDPCPEKIAIIPDNAIVIIEGSWLLLDEDPWRQISSLVDDTWFVDVAADLARHRIAKRHIGSGIEETWEDAVRRAESNDLPNGNEIRNKLVEPALVVQSCEAPAKTIA
jgi:pantothenate kinase